MRKTYIKHFRKYKAPYTVSAVTILLTSVLFPLVSYVAFELTGDTGVSSIISLLQKVTFWVGVSITTWGIVEAMVVRRSFN